MVDDVRDIAETAESKASQELLDRARLARERREAEQRKRLDELRAHAAAAQAQREKRDDDRRKRQAEQRARDDDRRIQVEERKRAIWEASVSRREALLQRERDRTERLERQRAARSAPRPAFAFGSSTPRLLEPVDSGGFFWAARSTNPIDQMNFFETLAASTTNVMFASAPLTRRASALQLDSDNDNKDEPDRSPLPAMWSSVARRRTDLVPTAPAPRAPGRAYSMTRLDRLPHSPHAHIPRTQTRSGETTPGSRPGSALSNATGVVRRPASAPRKPRPASIAGTGVNTPRGGVGETLSQSVATTPSVSRDSTVVCTNEAPRRTPRRPRPLSLHVTAKPLTPPTPGEGKPPLHRKPKTAKEHDKGRGKSSSVSPGRGLSPSPSRSKERILHALDKATPDVGASVVSAAEVTHKLEALHIHNGHGQQPIDNQSAVAEQQAIEANEQQTQINDKTMTQNEPHSEIVDLKQQEQLIEIADVSNLQIQDKNVEVKDKSDEVKDKNVEVKDKAVEVKDKIVEVKEDKKSEEASKTEQKKLEDKKEASVEKTDDSDIMSASMSARRITTEEQAKAALAERRRRAREELEKQAEIERQRLQREAEEEAERQRAEEERQLREEQEARELALLQRTIEEEKLRKAIEAQQQFEREEVERKAREELERQQKVREDEEKRRAAEEAEKQRREEAEREEKERIARKQRVEAIMARTRLRKAEEDKKQQENKPQPQAGTEPVVAGVDNHTANATGSVEPESSGSNNGNVATGDLLGFTSQCESEPAPSTEPAPHNNGNLSGELLDSQPHASEEKPAEATKVTENETTNGNMNLTTISSSFIQHEVATNEATQKIPEKIIEDDFTSHNGHNTINHPLTLQNAI